MDSHKILMMLIHMNSSNKESNISLMKAQVRLHQECKSGIFLIQL